MRELCHVVLVVRGGEEMWEFEEGVRSDRTVLCSYI